MVFINKFGKDVHYLIKYLFIHKDLILTTDYWILDLWQQKLH